VETSQIRKIQEPSWDQIQDQFYRQVWDRVHNQTSKPIWRYLIQLKYQIADQAREE
jgi:hypothetical protein